MRSSACCWRRPSMSLEARRPCWRSSKQAAYVGTRGFYPHFHIIHEDASPAAQNGMSVERRDRLSLARAFRSLEALSSSKGGRPAMKIRSPYRTQRLTGPDISGSPALTASFFMVAPSVSTLRRTGIPPRRLVTVSAQRMAAAMRMQESRRSRQTIDTISCWHGGQGGDHSRRAQQEEIFDVRL
jgi:hypothetical protein